MTTCWITTMIKKTNKITFLPTTKDQHQQQRHQHHQQQQQQKVHQQQQQQQQRRELQQKLINMAERAENKFKKSHTRKKTMI